MYGSDSGRRKDVTESERRSLYDQRSCCCDQALYEYFHDVKKYFRTREDPGRSPRSRSCPLDRARPHGRSLLFPEPAQRNGRIAVFILPHPILWPGLFYPACRHQGRKAVTARRWPNCLDMTTVKTLSICIYCALVNTSPDNPRRYPDRPEGIPLLVRLLQFLMRSHRPAEASSRRGPYWALTKACRRC